MKNVTIVLALLLNAGVLAGASDVPRPSGWSVQPSFQVFASVDEIDADAPEVVRNLAAANPALSLAAAAEIDWQGERGRVQASTLGLLASPLAKTDRNAFLAGRLHAVRSLGTRWRLSLDDSARWQRHETSALTDFQRNEAVFGLEWRRAQGGAVGFRLGDRRRSVPHLRELGFERQAVGVSGRIGVARRTSLEAATTWQRYSARTADGERVVLSLELARFTARGVACAWLGWFEPRHDRQRLAYVSGPSSPRLWATPVNDAEAGLGTSNSLVAAAALPATVDVVAVDAAPTLEGGWTADPALFDPLESDSDEWDFGLRKQVLAGTLSRRLGTAWSLSVVVRYQHKRGPNLLVVDESAGATYEDDRLALRASARRQLGPHVNLLLQACHLRNWSDRPSLRFSRTLAAIGLQIRP